MTQLPIKYWLLNWELDPAGCRQRPSLLGFFESSAAGMPISRPCKTLAVLNQSRTVFQIGSLAEFNQGQTSISLTALCKNQTITKANITPRRRKQPQEPEKSRRSFK